MKTKRNWLEAILLVVPFLALALCWSDLPARVPIHWNSRGEIDSWGARHDILLLPLLALALTGLLHILPWCDPKLRRASEEQRRMTTVLPILRRTLLAFFDVVFFVQIAASLGWEIDAGRVVLNSTILLFLVLGNYLGNLRPNYFIGIRTPWTLENPETWRATHRLGGRLLFLVALSLLGAQFFLDDRTFCWLCVSAIFSLAIWGIFYSWHHSRTHAPSR